MLLYSNNYYTNKQTNKMATIQVLTDILSGGYGPILTYYNTNKKEKWNPLRQLEVAEGGFEIELNPKELKKHLEWATTLTDRNNEVKQLRWNHGRLSSCGYTGFNEKETELLFKALQHSLGEENVILLDENTYINKTYINIYKEL